MDNFSNIIYLNPNQIQVIRENRQRTQLNITSLLDSIREKGVINPIIVKEISPTPNPQNSQILFTYDLVAGESRLEVCKQLNLNIPCRLLNNLDPIEAQIIEFEENHKRTQISWKDEILTIGNIHKSLLEKNPNHTQLETSKLLSIPTPTLSNTLYIYDNINEKILTYAENFNQALGLLNKFKPKKVEELKQNLNKLTSNPIPEYLKSKPNPPKIIRLNFETNDSQHTSHVVPSHVTNSQIINFQPIPEHPPILNQNFLDWIKTYSGPKFNLIHCDFDSSNEENFWVIFISFLGNLSKLLDNQAHILFWFNFNYLSRIQTNFKSLDLEIIPEPFIWFKSDTNQTQSFGLSPKQTYEACLIINYGNKPYLKQIQNIYHTPRDSKPICNNQKSIPMLKYLFRTFVNKNTNLFDPTCGSASALLAAEELNSKSILGLEINQERYLKSLQKIIKTREIRKLLER